MTLQGTNTYLVGTGKRRILVDTGEGKDDYPVLVKEVLQQQDCKIQHILLTHWHLDHVGGIRDVCDIHEGDAISLFKFPRVSTVDDMINTGEKKLSYSFLSKEEVFETEGATLRALYTPGHTDDHMAILLEEENAIFSGDCILGEGTAVFEDLYDYMKSLQQLFDLSPLRIYPGHGPVVENAKKTIGDYIAHRNLREKQILDVLESGDQSDYSSVDLVKVIYKDIPEHLYSAAAFNVTHHLQKLQKENRTCKRLYLLHYCTAEADAIMYY